MLFKQAMPIPMLLNIRGHKNLQLYSQPSSWKLWLKKIRDHKQQLKWVILWEKGTKNHRRILHKTIQPVNPCPRLRRYWTSMTSKTAYRADPWLPTMLLSLMPYLKPTRSLTNGWETSCLSNHRFTQMLQQDHYWRMDWKLHQGLEISIGK